MTLGHRGSGANSWIGDDYFITVDDLADALDLEAARTARALREEAVLDFVIAPIPADDGALVVGLAGRWVMHVYERLDIVDDTTFGPHEDPEVLGLVRAIHDATDIVGHHAHREDFSIWGRDDLEEALAVLDEPWHTGPYGEQARRWLAANAEDVASMLPSMTVSPLMSMMTSGLSPTASPTAATSSARRAGGRSSTGTRS